MFDWIKKLFRKSEKPAETQDPFPQQSYTQHTLIEKQCKSCGKPFSIDLSWEYSLDRMQKENEVSLEKVEKGAI